MKQMLIMTCMIALSFPLALTGCYRTERESLRAALAKTESERDDLKARMDIVMQTRDQLQKQVSDLTALATGCRTSLPSLPARVTCCANRLTSSSSLAMSCRSEPMSSASRVTPRWPRRKRPRKESTILPFSCRPRPARSGSYRSS